MVFVRELREFSIPFAERFPYSSICLVILVQLFIAVINENFNVAEELKKQKQTSHYLAMQHPVQASPRWLMRLNPYRWFKGSPQAVAVENLPSNLVLPMQKSMMQDQMMSMSDGLYKNVSLSGIVFDLLNQPWLQSAVKQGSLPRHYSNKSIHLLNRLFTGENGSELVPLATLRSTRQPASETKVDKMDDDELARQL